MAATFTFPDENISPKLKGYDWLLQYCRAAFSAANGYTPATMGWFGRQRFAEIRKYAQGMQSITKMKEQQSPDKPISKSSGNLDFNPPCFLSKFRNIAVSKLLQRNFDTECFAVDALAKGEADAKFDAMKVKIMMRQMAMQQGSELANSPALMPNTNEPQDLEQLEMSMKYNYKHQMAMEGELGISLVKNQNNFEEIRKRTLENQFDYGIGGYKEWIDYNGMIKVREIVPENLVISYCLKNDFSDLVYWGEIIYMSVSDLAPYFNQAQMVKICESVVGKYGNPSVFPITQTVSQSFYKFKVAMMDFELITYNTTVYENTIDNRGNPRFRKTEFENYKKKDTVTNNQGEQEPKYMDSTRKAVYKMKWLVGTDMAYDWGLSTNNKIKQSCWWDASLSCHLYSWNFYNMSYSGITEKLIPIEDALQQTWLKLENLKAKLIPYLIKLDLNAFEGVNFAKGGKKFDPADLVDFMYSEFTLLYRATDLLNKNPNYDPARIEATGQLQAYQAYVNEIQSLLQTMRDISGLNEVTDGSTINEKNLNSTNAAMQESTNNALYPIMFADQQLNNKLCDGIVQRIQVAVQLGKVQGYAKALGEDTVKFYEISPEISNYELGIFTKPAPTAEEKKALMMEITKWDSQGLLQPEDIISITSCTNLKQEAELIAYKVSKRKEQQQQQALQVQQAQAQGNAQVAQATEQAKQQTIQLQAQLDAQLLNMEKEWDFRIESMKKQVDFNAEQTQVEGRTTGHEIQANAKIEASKIAVGGHVVGTHLKAGADIAMTAMDNETKEKTAAKKKVA